MIASVSKTNELLNKYNLRAKKGFGQNFLIDGNIVNRIVDTASVDNNTGVIEIGPGLGSMTEALATKAGKVLCYEIDEDMINILNQELLTKFSNIKIINKDILKLEIENDLDYFKGLEKIICVSNLPYYITTPIIMKLLTINELSLICVMVQKEVALRFCAKPSTKDYGSLTVLINYKTDAKLAFNVSRNCFLPSPNVDSAIVLMKSIKRDYSLNNEPNFLNFIKNSFAMKRKTFVNNVLSIYTISKDKILNCLNTLNLKESIRSEEINLDNFVKIYQILFEDKNDLSL